MQMVKKVFIVFSLVWVAFLMFMPKAEFYYALEEKLVQKDIRLNEGNIEEGLFSLTLSDVTVYVKGIELAKIKELHFFTLLFYTSLTLKTLEVDSSLHSKLPALTHEASATYTLFVPMQLSLDANGSFGTVEGEVDILAKTVHINFLKTQEIGIFKPFLKKDEKGWYYEGSF
jgi:hypothetical protein